MALSFLEPPHQLLDGLFPSLDLDRPMPNETDIWCRALTFEGNLI